VPADAAGTGGVRALVFLRDRGIVILWILLVVFFSFWAEPFFFTWTNARLVANAAALSALFAAAVAFGIMSGALDLSIPGSAAVAGVVAGKLLSNGTSPGLAIVAALATGALIGLCNGLMIQRGLNPLVVSIATLTALGGIANLIAGGVAIRSLDQLDWLGSGRPLGIPSMVFVVAGLYLAAWLFLTQTRGGARLQAVGGSAEAVRRVGINADVYRILGFVLGATCGALAGLATLATTRQASPSASVSLLFAALAAVALSGMPLTGGRGSFPRVLVGTLIIATINSALVIRGIQPYWTTIITGFLLILALTFEKVMSSAVTARLTESADLSVHDPVGTAASDGSAVAT
jgi:ribose/xylose/arabinose/galactoside ABC-type transport system permease subunit